MSQGYTISAFVIGAMASSVVIRKTLVAGWPRSRAKVVSLGPPRAEGEVVVQPTMSPMILFLTTDGRKVVIEDRRLRFGPAVVGEEFAIRYRPSDPSKAIPDEFMKRFRIEVCFAIFGAVFAIAEFFA